MYLGQVIGTVVCTQKYEGLTGARFLIVQPMDAHGKPVGPPEVALDTVSAAPQQKVYLVGSREAALAWDPTFVPVDSAVVGIVDAVNT